VKKYTKALIIDDDPDLCQLLKSVLDTIIPIVEYTHTLKSGIKFLTQLQPDIVFLDNNLPDGQGTTLVKDIKSISPLSFVVFITALDSSKEKALTFGADAFLEKPLTYASILQILDNLEPVKENLMK
jgi:DNA-binding response OmpR family regulator